MRYRNNDLEAKGWLFLVFCIILAIVWMLGGMHEIDVWNGGVHSGCGGHWVYEQAVGHRYTTDYIYRCDKCGYRYEFNEMR